MGREASGMPSEQSTVTGLLDCVRVPATTVESRRNDKSLHPLILNTPETISANPGVLVLFHILALSVYSPFARGQIAPWSHFRSFARK
jgi:hypothetical protein